MDMYRTELAITVVAFQKREVAQNSEKIGTYSSSRSSTWCQSKAHMELPISN